MYKAVAATHTHSSKPWASVRVDVLRWAWSQKNTKGQRYVPFGWQKLWLTGILNPKAGRNASQYPALSAPTRTVQSRNLVRFMKTADSKEMCVGTCVWSHKFIHHFSRLKANNRERERDKKRRGKELLWTAQKGARGGGVKHVCCSEDYEAASARPSGKGKLVESWEVEIQTEPPTEHWMLALERPIDESDIKKQWLFIVSSIESTHTEWVKEMRSL